MTERKILITGGAGFIGSNLAHQLLLLGKSIRIYDNLSRKGTVSNIAWLQEQHPTGIEFVRGDTRDFARLRKAVEDVDIIFHLAAQVAVTTSVFDPRSDFETNALGTFNLLEAARLGERKPIIVYTSTNKVYGGMDDLAIEEKDTRYVFRDYPLGITEDRSLDFHSPYGCSKGAADQYMHDYARIYGLPTVVFRMSCIYGTRQFGNEDQGWVAHFVISSALGQPIKIFGNGKQVRDILWVEDLVHAFLLAVDKIDITAGEVYNVGGGAKNSISIWVEFEEIMSDLLGRKLSVDYGDWRPGDQPVYVSNIMKIQQAIGWTPEVNKHQGIEKLYHWVMENQNLFT